MRLLLLVWCLPLFATGQERKETSVPPKAPEWVKRVLTKAPEARIDAELLKKVRSNPESRPRLILDIASSELRLLVGKEDLVLSTPLAHGRRGHEPTPGTYRVLETEKDARIPDQGSYQDEEGNKLLESIDRKNDPLPSGGVFAAELTQISLKLGLEDEILRLSSGQAVAGASTAGDAVIPLEVAQILAEVLRRGDEVVVSDS